MAYDPLVLNPGDLRESITIQTPTTVNDQFDTPSTQWSDYFTAYAKIQSTATATFKTLVSSGMVTDQATTQMTIRWPGYNLPINSTMRVVYGDNIYQIALADNVLRRNIVVKLYCTAFNSESN